jgi:hypothetical protein
MSTNALYTFDGKECNTRDVAITSKMFIREDLLNILLKSGTKPWNT